MLYSVHTITTCIYSGIISEISGSESGFLTGYVHSSYGKAINLCAGSVFLALQPAGSPVSPISLITELSARDFAALSVMKDQPVRIYPDRVEIRAASGTLCFSFSDAKIFDSALTPGRNSALHPSHFFLQSAYPEKSSEKFSLQHSLAEALSAPNPSMFAGILLPDSRSETAAPGNFTAAAEYPAAGSGDLTAASGDFLIAAAAEKFLQETAALSSQKEYAKAAAVLARLIGLGRGLTPAGDDFLCGVLACFILAGKTDCPLFFALKKEIQLNLNRTNDLSAAFLCCAVSGHFSESVTLLPACKSPEEITSLFRKIGHSSGMDTLCGIYYGTVLLSSGF